MRLPQLDDRLFQAASLFPACEYGADIGADHGRLSCYLLANQTCQRMCVSDISAESLSKAERLLQLHHLDSRADFCVGDGFDALPKPAEVAAILGMGGNTLCQILKNGKPQKTTLILSAHTDVPYLRQTLQEIGYVIDAEVIAWAAKRFYVVLRAVPGQKKYSEKELFLGPCLMRSPCSEKYLSYLQWRIRVEQERKQEDAIWKVKALKEELLRVSNSEIF